LHQAYNPLSYVIGVNPGSWGVATPPTDFGLGGRGGSHGVVKHFYILSSTGSIFESGVFSSEIE